MQVLNDQAFAILVLMALFTTFITTPIVIGLYKPARKSAPYKHKTIKRKELDTELRILACFHSTRNIPTMINIIESSRGTRRKGRLCVYAMHLMELSERSSAVSMVHKARKNGLPFWIKKRDDQDRIVIAFDAYQQLSSVSVRPMTAISALNSIHEDICTSAHQKRAALILLPFHKHQRVDGVMESLGHSFHLVNQRVLRHAPCSVGILVDRGLGGTTQVSASDVSYTVVVPFFGGKDDQEALAYGARMAEHPGIELTILKFTAAPGHSLMPEGAKVVDDEGESDQGFISECMSRKNESSTIKMEEKVVASKGDIIEALKSRSKSSIFIVGRMTQTAPLMERSDNAELGPIGSYLASSDFSNAASVIVVQQYDPNANLRPLVEEQDTEEFPDTPR